MILTLAVSIEIHVQWFNAIVTGLKGTNDNLSHVAMTLDKGRRIFISPPPAGEKKIRERFSVVWKQGTNQFESG